MAHRKPLTEQQTEAVELLRADENAMRSVQIMARDNYLQRLVAIWHLVPIGTAPDDYQATGEPPAQVEDLADLPAAEQTAVAWEGLAPDATVMRQLLGAAIDVAGTAKRAIRLGLVLPDGTLNRYADAWITAETTKLLEGMKNH